MKTTYLVFRMGDADGMFIRAGEVEASNADQAIRQVVEKVDEDKRGGDWVATPSRSWTRRTVEPVVQTRLKLT